jgi:hypothetical protein
MEAKDFKLDYFQIYRVFNQTADYKVQLQGQFETAPQRSVLRTVVWFANPASKNGEAFYDKNAHFTGYRFSAPDPEPERVVEIENQFHRSEIHIDDGYGLLVRAKKIERGSAMPEALDHYKVYFAGGATLVENVKPEDQWGISDATVLFPRFFAVPVRKRYLDEDFRVENEKTHLVLYMIHPQPKDIRLVQSYDQFASRYLQIWRRQLLAVPTIKHKWYEL